MKPERIASGVISYIILLLIPPVVYGQSHNAFDVPEGHIDKFQLARKHAGSSPETRKQMRVNRVYTLDNCRPLNFYGEEEKKAAQMGDMLRAARVAIRFQNEIRNVLADVDILTDDPQERGRSSANRKDAMEEYTLREFEFHEKAEREGKDGDKFVIARVLVGTCNSMAAEDIDLMYYVIRHLLFRPLMSAKGTFDHPDEVIGDACYHLSRDAIGFLRGNVVVEINISQFQRQSGSVVGLGRPQPLRTKMVEAARRIDALLMEKMFSEEVRAQIRAAERKRNERGIDEELKPK